MKEIAIWLIRVYRLTLGPFVGQSCRFAPSCSEYSSQAFHKYGFLMGLWLTLKRLAKCHPWHPGGVDDP